MIHGLMVVLGLTDASGPWYLWWSGFGGRVALGGALIATYWRHHNCHKPWCWRLGHPDPDSGKPVCRHHHPHNGRPWAR